MPLDSEQSNDQDEPLALERRRPDEIADSIDPDCASGKNEGHSSDDHSEIDQDEDFLPIQTSNQVTIYSAKSDIRSPLKLLGQIFSDFLAGREIAWRLFLRNIRGLYRQTLLGLFWAFLPPIANTAFWIFLRQAGVFTTDDLTVNATVYILTGMIFWQAFIDAFQMPLQTLNKNRAMISKLNFPRESLLLVGFGEVLFDLAIRMLLLIPAFLIFKVSFSATMLLTPFAFLSLVILGAGLGLILLPFGSLYQDVGRFISMALPFWMILTPIVYPPWKDGVGSLLNWLNPASPLLILARDWMVLGQTNHLGMGLLFGLAAIPILILGLVIYRISIPVLVERMSA
jgi:lipopolysaccharide transport system permease protein